MRDIPLDHQALAFHGAISVQQTEDGPIPWRLPVHELDLFDPVLRHRASKAAGVRLSFITNANRIELQARHMLLPHDDNYDEVWKFDCFVDGRFHARVRQPTSEEQIIFDDLPEGEHHITIWLPQFAGVCLRAVRLSDDATLKAWHDPRPRWLVYGSSITHCRGAAGPSETWPALVAQRFGLNLICMGFGGQCHLDPMVARVIAHEKVDYIGLCLGINVQGGMSLSQRTFAPAVIGLIKTIRDQQPTTPIACISPICSPPRESQTNAVNLNLAIMRDHIQTVVNTLRDRGDANLHYVNGLDIMGPDEVKYMPDELHPNAQGYRVLAEQYGKVVMPLFGLSPVSS